METNTEPEPLFTTGDIPIHGDEDALVGQCQRHGVFMRRSLEATESRPPLYEFLATEPILASFLSDVYGMNADEIDDFLYEF